MATFGIPVESSAEYGSTLAEILTFIAQYITVYWKDGTKSRVTDFGNLNTCDSLANPHFIGLQKAIKTTVHLHDDIVTEKGKPSFFINLQPDEYMLTPYAQFDFGVRTTTLAYKVDERITMTSMNTYTILASSVVWEDEKKEIAADTMQKLMSWSSRLYTEGRIPQIKFLLANTAMKKVSE